MRYYTNGIEMNPAFEKALTLYIKKARDEGCTATDEEISAAFEVLIMDAAGIAVPSSTRLLAAKFEDEMNGDSEVDLWF